MENTMGKIFLLFLLINQCIGNDEYIRNYKLLHHKCISTSSHPLLCEERLENTLNDLFDTTSFSITKMEIYYEKHNFRKITDILYKKCVNCTIVLHSDICSGSDGEEWIPLTFSYKINPRIINVQRRCHRLHKNIIIINQMYVFHMKQELQGMSYTGKNIINYEIEEEKFERIKEHSINFHEWHTNCINNDIHYNCHGCVKLNSNI